MLWSRGTTVTPSNAEPPDNPARKKPKTGISIASGSHEQAGNLLLLAAATETGLLTQLEQALPPSPVPPEPLCLPLAASPAVRQRLLLTRLFLGTVGLSRTWNLRGYTADGLALLTGRMRAYGYRSTETFLSQLARADGAERFTNALASWTTHLWHSTEDTGGGEVACGRMPRHHDLADQSISGSLLAF